MPKIFSTALQLNFVTPNESQLKAINPKLGVSTKDIDILKKKNRLFKLIPGGKADLDLMVGVEGRTVNFEYDSDFRKLIVELFHIIGRDADAAMKKE